MAFDVKYIIELIDKFSPQAKNIVVVQQQITVHMEKLAKKTQKATSSFKKFGRIMSTYVSAPMGILGVSAIHVTKSFEQSMSTIQSVTGALDPVMEKFKKHVLEMGANTRVSAIKIADASAEMSRYKISLEDIDKMMGQVIPFATANMRDGIIDVHSASIVAIRAIRGLNLPMSVLPDFLKRITAASHASGLTIDEFAQSLKYLDTPMRAMHVPYKNVITLAGVFALAMKHGGQGAREARAMFQNLQHPTTELKRLFAGLNIKVFDTQGHFMGMNKMFEVMEKNFKDSPRMTGQAADAMRVIIQSGKKGWESMDKSAKKTWLQNKLYKSQNESLAGSLDKLQNSLQSLSISMVESQLGPLNGMINTMQDFIVKALGMSKSTKGIIAGAIGISTFIGPAAYNLGIFLATLKYLGVTIPAITTFIGEMALGFVGLWGAILAPVLIIGGGFALATVAIVKFLNMFKWGRNLVKYLGDAFEYFIHNQIQTLIDSFHAVGHAFSWLYTLIHGKPLKVDAGISGGITNYGGVGAMGQQSVRSSLDVNVFDPKGYIKSVSGRSQADDFNVALGANMAFSR